MKKELTYNQKRVLDLINFGKHNRISKFAISLKTGLTARKIREITEELRKLGYPILYESGTAGYWRAETFEEKERFVQKEIDSRIKSLSKQKQGLRKPKLTRPVVQQMEAEL